MNSFWIFSLNTVQKDYLNQLYAPQLLKFMARYKFVIAYENGVCEDYITEKFWRPLIAGSIPLYFGSPSIKVRKFIKKNKKIKKR